MQVPDGFVLPAPLNPESFPLPSPPLFLKHQVYDVPEVFDKVDQHAIYVSKREHMTFRELMWDLVYRVRLQELEKARVIFRWMTSKNMYEIQFEDELPGTPEDILTSFRKRKGTLARIMEVMCCYAHIPCISISGYAKGVEYLPGQKFHGRPANHSWNAIFIQNSWQLIDAHWATRYLSSDKNVPENLVYEYDDFYFIMEPQQAVYSHFPNNEAWQLLDRPLTLQQFEDLPLTKSQFFKCGMDFRQQHHGVVHTREGKLKMCLGFWKPGSFTYGLQYGESMVESFSGIPLKNYALQETLDLQLNFFFRLPLTGVYYLTVYASDAGATGRTGPTIMRNRDRQVVAESVFRAACEYKIVCDTAAPDAAPYPACHDVNWGPAWPLINHYGLVPSISDGVIPTYTGAVEVRFQRQKPEVNLLAKLHKNGVEDEILDEFLQEFVTETGDVVFTAQLPEGGEYGMEIYANDPEFEEGTYTHICQYMISFQAPAGYRSKLKPLLKQQAQAQQGGSAISHANPRQMWNYEDHAPSMGTLPQPYLANENEAVSQMTAGVAMMQGPSSEAKRTSGTYQYQPAAQVEEGQFPPPPTDLPPPPPEMLLAEGGYEPDSAQGNYRMPAPEAVSKIVAPGNDPPTLTRLQKNQGGNRRPQEGSPQYTVRNASPITESVGRSDSPKYEVRTASPKSGSSDSLSSGSPSVTVQRKHGPGQAGAGGQVGIQGHMGPGGSAGMVPGGQMGMPGQYGVKGQMGPKGNAQMAPGGQPGISDQFGLQGQVGAGGQVGIQGQMGPGGSAGMVPGGQMGMPGQYGVKGQMGPKGNAQMAPGGQPGISDQFGLQGQVGAGGQVGIQGQMGPGGRAGMVPGGQMGMPGQYGVKGQMGPKGNAQMAPGGQPGISDQFGLQGQVGAGGQVGIQGQMGPGGSAGMVPGGQMGMPGQYGVKGQMGPKGNAQMAPGGQPGISDQFGLQGQVGAGGQVGIQGQMGPGGSAGMVPGGQMGMPGQYGVRGQLGPKGNAQMAPGGQPGISDQFGLQGQVGAGGQVGIQGQMGPGGSAGMVPGGQMGMPGQYGVKGQMGPKGNAQMAPGGQPGISDQFGLQGQVGAGGQVGIQGQMGPGGSAGMVPGGQMGMPGQYGVKGQMGPKGNAQMAPGGQPGISDQFGLQGQVGAGGQVGIQGQMGPGGSAGMVPGGQMGMPGQYGVKGQMGPKGNAQMAPGGQPGISDQFGLQGQVGAGGQVGIQGQMGPGGSAGMVPGGQMGMPGQYGVKGQMGPKGNAQMAPGGQPGISDQFGLQGQVGAGGQVGIQGQMGPGGRAGMVPGGQMGMPGQYGVKGQAGPRIGVGVSSAPGQKGSGDGAVEIPVTVLKSQAEIPVQGVPGQYSRPGQQSAKAQIEMKGRTGPEGSTQGQSRGQMGGPDGFGVRGQVAVPMGNVQIGQGGQKGNAPGKGSAADDYRHGVSGGRHGLQHQRGPRVGERGAEGDSESESSSSSGSSTSGSDSQDSTHLVTDHHPSDIQWRGVIDLDDVTADDEEFLAQRQPYLMKRLAKAAGSRNEHQFRAYGDNAPVMGHGDSYNGPGSKDGYGSRGTVNIPVQVIPSNNPPYGGRPAGGRYQSTAYVPASSMPRRNWPGGRDQYNRTAVGETTRLEPVMAYNPEQSTANWSRDNVGMVPPPEFHPEPVEAESAPKPVLSAIPQEQISSQESATDALQKFEKVDTHAMDVSKKTQDNFNQLIWQLIYARNITDDLEKVRAIFAWLCTKDLSKMNFVGVKENTPEDILMGIKTGKSTYAQIFQMLCQYAGVHCTIVPGYAKGAEYVPGMRFSGRQGQHSWNAVLISGVWRLVDCHWAARRLIGKQSSVENIRYELDMFYFLPNPIHLIYTHFPFESDWQLMRDPIPLPEFESLAPVKSAFFKYGLQLQTHRHAVISCAQELTLKIAHPPGTEDQLSFTYTLGFADAVGSSHGELEEWNGLKLIEYGMQEMTADDCSTFTVRPPRPGAYKFLIYAKRADAERPDIVFGAVCEYKIEADFPSATAMPPFPPCQNHSYGPCEAARRYGLASSSPSAVLLTGVTGVAEVRVRLSRPGVRMMAKLRSRRHSEDLLARCLLMRHIADREVIVSVFPPDAGEFGLELYASDAQTETTSYYMVWQHLVVAQTASPVRGLPTIPASFLGPLPKFSQYGLEAVSHVDPFIQTNTGELCVQIRCNAGPLRMMAQLVVATNDANDDCSQFVLQQSKHDSVYFLFRFPRPGYYKFIVFALPFTELSESIPAVFNYLVEASAESKNPSPFPQQFQQWKEGCYLNTPLDGQISPSGAYIKFDMEVPKATAVAVVIADDWTQLEKKEGGERWTADVYVEKHLGGGGKRVSVCANYGQFNANYSTILEYAL